MMMPSKLGREAAALQTDIAIQEQTFNSIVTRSYLRELCRCQVNPLAESGDLTKISWFKIDKIVIEKGVFFPDKLSMLYTSLHDTAKNVILVLDKQNNEKVDIYLGARDHEGQNLVSGEILEAGLDGYFPGTGFVPAKQMPELAFSNPAITSVSATASLRDDKKEEFVQGIERLINATSNIGRFRTYFIADSVDEREARKMIDAFSRLHTSLAPMQSEQMTFSESDTQGVSKSLTENFSKSVGESISNTVTRGEGVSETTTTGESETTNFLIYSISSTTSTSTTTGRNYSNSESNTKGSSEQTTTGTSEQSGTNESKTMGQSRQITLANRTAKYYLDIIDKHIEGLQNGSPFGLWSVATYFVANDSTTARMLSNIYRGSIIGENSGLTTCAINAWSNPEAVTQIQEYLDKGLNPRFNFNNINVSAATIVTSKELAIHLSLPQSSVPGIIVEERSSFARNVTNSATDGDCIEIGKVLHLGKESETPVRLSVDDLTKHTFITGSTGSGKSNTIYLLLKELYEKGTKILVIEPAKGEYKQVFGNMPGVHVYGSNPNITRLLRINPFEFNDGIHVYEHIDSLVEIFNACWPMYAAMPVVLKKAITDAYRNCGWDLDLSTTNSPFGIRLFPTIKDVVSALQDYINSSEYSEQTKGDYKGAIETRLLSLSEGLTGSMLNNPQNNLSDEDLFENNVIVDLSKVNNSETKSLIMGLLIMKLSEYYQANGRMNSGLKHVTVLEEAHNILKRTSIVQNQESSNLAGKSVEMISNSIAEMRTYGEGFIIVDQSPSQVDMSSIRNTNTKIIMSLLEAEDKECAGRSISLTDEQIEEIGRQKVGQAIVYQNSWEEPVQCKISKAPESETSFTPQKDEAIGGKAPDNELIIRFLYSICNNGEFNDFDSVKQKILESKYPSSIKNSLLKVLCNYQSGEFALDENSRAKTLELAGACLGEFAAVQKIMSFKKNPSEIGTSLQQLVKSAYGINDPLMLKFCVRCMFRLQAVKSSKVTPLYNEWHKLNYKG